MSSFWLRYDISYMRKHGLDGRNCRHGRSGTGPERHRVPALSIWTENVDLEARGAGHVCIYPIAR